jgi:hypothetical protein
MINSTGMSRNAETFELPDLDDPIVPCTPDCDGVISISVAIIFLAMVPGVVDLDAPKNTKCR